MCDTQCTAADEPCQGACEAVRQRVTLVRETLVPLCGEVTDELLPAVVPVLTGAIRVLADLRAELRAAAAPGEGEVAQ